MPTYVYRCSKCGDEFEVMQKMADAPLKRCKKCRGALQRVYQPAGIVLKGPGFYRNDNRSSRSRASEAKSEGSKSEGSKSEGSKSDTKSESKPSETKKSGSSTSKSSTTSSD